MTVSDKMLNAFYDVDSSTLVITAEVAEQTVQAIINAAWNKFDYDDKSTWPDKTGAVYFVQTDYGVDSKQWDSRQLWVGGTLGRVIRYAKRNDLLFVQGSGNNESK